MRTLIGLMCLALGCNGGSSTPTDGGDTGGGDGGARVITVFTQSQPQTLVPIQQTATAFTAQTGIQVNIVTNDFNHLMPTAQSEATAGSSRFDVLVFLNIWVPDLVNLGYVQDLTPLITRDAADPQLALSDIPAGIQAKNVYGGHQYMFLVDNDNMFLHYRKDILGSPTWAAAYLAWPGNTTHQTLPNPPQTWDDAVSVAAFFSGCAAVTDTHCPGLDWDTTNPGNEMGFATETQGGQAMWYASCIAAPYAVMPNGSHGMTGGNSLMFEPDMTPIVNTPGFVEGVTRWAHLVDCCIDSNPDGMNMGTSRAEIIQQMITGRTLMALDWGDIAPALLQDGTNGEPYTATVRQSQMGWAIAPAAKHYYDWTTQAFVETQNSAPFNAANGWAAYMTSTSRHQDLAWQFMKFLISPANSSSMVASPLGGYQPWRSSHCTNLAPYLAAGWSSDAAMQYCEAILASVNHPNSVIDVRIPGIFTYYSFLTGNLSGASNGGLPPGSITGDLVDHTATPLDAMNATAASWVTTTTMLGQSTEQAAYHAHLGIP